MPALPYDRIRLPVQTGQSGLLRATGAFYVLLPAAVLCGLAGFVGFLLSVSIGLPFLIVGLVGALMGTGRGGRASDIVLDEDGVRMVGGPRGFTSAKWVEVDPARCSVEAGEGLRSDLHLGLRDGRSVVIATAAPGKADQRECLIAVCDALRGARWGRPEGQGAGDASSPAPTEPAQTWRCASCGFAMAPVDAEEAPCPHCEAVSPVPEDLRARIRDGQVVSQGRRKTEALVARVLRYPRAGRVNLVLRGAGLAILLLVPLFGVLRSLSVALFAMALIMMLLCWMRVEVADRSAARYLAVNFAARRPRTADSPYRCHGCGGPLPKPHAESDVVVRCAYCDADNVLGLDLRREAAGVEPQRRALERAFERRKKERIAGWARVALAACVAFFSGKAWIADLGAPVRTEPPAEAAEEMRGHGFAANYGRFNRAERDCRFGNPAACLDLGELLADGTVWSADEASAVERFKQACVLGADEACFDLGLAYEGSDPALAMHLYGRACRRDRAWACNRFHQLQTRARSAPEDDATSPDGSTEFGSDEATLAEIRAQLNGAPR